MLTLLFLAAAPNVVFILTDDQGYGDVSRHGNPVLKTPNIDRLHDEGVRFTDFQVSPTCSPTRSALFTGRHEFKNGITHTILERERLTLKATTLAQSLKGAGYTTGVFGKWHLGDAAPYQPDRRGFDEVYIHGCGGIGQTYEGTCADVPGNMYVDPTLMHNGKFVKTKGYCTDLFFAQAGKWIEAARKPFFAYIATNAPHTPLQVRPEDEVRYAGKVDANTAKFFGMVANIDDNIGRLLAFLDEKKLAKNTLVVFMNDNGGTGGVKIWNAGMRGKKGEAYRGGVRASSLWRWPGTLKPADVDTLAAHIDFFPTIAELAGAKLPTNQVEGRSLVPLLKNARGKWPDRNLFTHTGRWPKGTDPDEWKYRSCSVRNSRWHLVSAKGGKTPAWELFDLTADPGESKDVATDHPLVMKDMTAAYETWWSEARPMMVNEAATGPAVPPYVELYRTQFAN